MSPYVGPFPGVRSMSRSLTQQEAAIPVPGGHRTLKEREFLVSFQTCSFPFGRVHKNCVSSSGTVLFSCISLNKELLFPPVWSCSTVSSGILAGIERVPCACCTASSWSLVLNYTELSLQLSVEFTFCLRNCIQGLCPFFLPTGLIHRTPSSPLGRSLQRQLYFHLFEASNSVECLLCTGPALGSGNIWIHCRQICLQGNRCLLGMNL